MTDDVQHPRHYTAHPSGVECVEISRWETAALAQVIQYIWRHRHKGGIEDLRKAQWWLQAEIDRLETMPKGAMEKEWQAARDRDALIAAARSQRRGGGGPK